MKLQIRLNNPMDVHLPFFIILADDVRALRYKYAGKNNLYDVDECQECGWISPEHFNSICDFVIEKHPEFFGRTIFTQHISLDS